MFEILREDECGYVVLVSEKQRSWNDMSFERIKRVHDEFVSDGEYLLDRVVTISYWNYVRVLALADVILDTSPYVASERSEVTIPTRSNAFLKLTNSLQTTTGTVGA